MAKRALRIQPPSPSVPERIDSAVATNDILRQGQEAIEAYDYELARNLLERAFFLSGGNADAALALLTLLVDHLVADDEALAFWPKLSAEARASSDIRVLVALAAARTGDVSRAKLLVAAIDGTRAAEIMTLLATNALQAGDLADAGKLAEDARSRDPAHPGARDVTERIAKARNAERIRLEEELEFALADGQRQEALRLAEAIIKVFPESAAARQIVREAMDERRHEDAKQHIAAAEEALLRGDLDTALQWLRRAEQVLATSSGSDALRAHITILEADAKMRSMAVAVTDIWALIDRDSKSGLLRYAASPDEIRAAVRKTNSSFLVETLERVLSKRIKIEDAVNAVLDLAEVMPIVDQHPRMVFDKLAQHERVLAGISEATKVQTRARELLENERFRRISEVFLAVRSAIDAGKAQNALDMLGNVDPHDVRASDRERMDALRKEANEIIERRSLEKRYEQLLSTDPLAACEVAEQLLARTDVDHAQWQGAIGVARRNARRLFGIWVVEDLAIETPKPIEGPVQINLDAPLSLPLPLDGTLPWLDSEGRTFVVTEGYDRWLFIRVIQAATGKIQSRVILRMPERVGTVDSMVTKSNTLCVVSDDVAIFEISLASWDPLFWRASHELVARGEIVDDVKLVPETRFVWMQSRRGDDLGRVLVIDAQRRRMTREIEDIWGFEWVVDVHGARMVCSGARERVTLYDMRGAPTQDRFVFSNSMLNHVVVHPSGAGLLVTYGVTEELIEFEEIGNAPNFSGHKWSGTVAGHRESALATSLRGCNAYFFASMPTGDTLWEELGFVDGRLRKRGQAMLPGRPHIVQDPGQQRVVALFQDGLRLSLVPLSEKIPVVPAIQRHHTHVVNPLMPYGCGFPEERTGETFPHIAMLDHLPPSVQIERLHAAAAKPSLTPADVFDMHRMLVSMKKTVLASALLAWMQQNTATHPYADLIGALEALNHGSLAEAMVRFEGIELERIAASHRPHVCHELALAYIHAGESEQAVAVLQAGIRAGESRCNLQVLLDLVAPLPDEEDSGQSILTRIRHQVRRCDVWLDKREYVKAREAIDVLDIWDAEEVQSLARLAAVDLQFEPRSDAERFRKALALARFLNVHRVTGSLRKEFIVDGAKWPRSKLDEVAEQATKWLEGLA